MLLFTQDNKETDQVSWSQSRNITSILYNLKIGSLLFYYGDEQNVWSVLFITRIFTIFYCYYYSLLKDKKRGFSGEWATGFSVYVGR